MKRIPCPHCGMRDENEFTWGGPADLARPSLDCSDEAWRDYLFVRANPRGTSDERWCHTYGCGQWFRIERDTLTHAIHRAARIQHAAPIQHAASVQRPVVLSEAKDPDAPP